MLLRLLQNIQYSAACKNNLKTHSNAQNICSLKLLGKGTRLPILRTLFWHSAELGRSFKYAVTSCPPPDDMGNGF